MNKIVVHVFVILLRNLTTFVPRERWANAQQLFRSSGVAFCRSRQLGRAGNDEQLAPNMPRSFWTEVFSGHFLRDDFRRCSLLHHTAPSRPLWRTVRVQSKNHSAAPTVQTPSSPPGPPAHNCDGEAKPFFPRWNIKLRLNMSNPQPTDDNAFGCKRTWEPKGGAPCPAESSRLCHRPNTQRERPVPCQTENRAVASRGAGPLSSLPGSSPSTKLGSCGWVEGQLH